MKISYAITTHNEGQCIDTLLKQITFVRDHDCEIVVLDDESSDPLTVDILAKWKDVGVIDKLVISKFNGNFADHKNKFFDICSGDYIFQLDADERLGRHLLDHATWIIDDNKEVDLFFIPRVNMVEGITQDDIEKYGWSISSDGWIQWPDPQGRLYKNKEHLRWSGKVHETISGARFITVLPFEYEWSILHFKDIHKQRLQNEFYKNL